MCMLSGRERERESGKHSKALAKSRRRENFPINPIFGFWLPSKMYDMFEKKGTSKKEGLPTLTQIDAFCIN
jgi:hypothetical protein